MSMVRLSTQVQRPEEVLVFARVISAQTMPEGVEGAIRISQEQLPDPPFGAAWSLMKPRLAVVHLEYSVGI
jgi:hypothetical protein